VTSFQRSIASYEAQFGSKPKWVAHAPGRVNLIGEHIDYNDGFVLPAAIDRRLSIAASPVNHPEILIYSEQEKQQVHFSLDAPLLPSGKWTDYVIGVVEYWRRLETRPVGLKLAIASDVPYGSGLSSSAALEMAFATLIGEVWGLELDPVAKALKCQQVESDFVGMPCGIMDQFASVNGKKDHLLLLDCDSQQAEVVPFTSDEYSILIIDSNVKHSLANGEYRKRRAECEAAAETLNVDTLRQATMDQLEKSASKMDPIIFRRARHVIGEIGRTEQAAVAMRAGDWATVGELMLASHNSLRDDYEVSCKELDVLVELMMELGESKGVLGTRMTGGGFGGCTVSVVPTSEVDDLIAGVSQRYIEKIGIEPEIFTTRPAEGTRMIKA